MHDVAILHDVVFSLDRQLACCLDRRLRAKLEEIVALHDLCANESTLEVGVDLAGSLGRPGASVDGPGMNLRLSNGEKRDEIQRAIPGADDFVKPWLIEPERLDELRALFFGELHDLGLDRCADHDDGNPALFTEPANLRDEGVFVDIRELFFLDVGDEKRGLVGEQKHVSADLLFVLVRGFDGCRRLALVEQGFEPPTKNDRLLFEWVLALGGALGPVEPPLHRLEVLQDQLGFDRLDIRDRIDPVVDVHDVLVLEAPDHVGDCVRLPDIAQEGIALTLALRGTLYQSRNVDELDRRRHYLLRCVKLDQLVEARVRDRDDSDVRVDRAKGVVRRLGFFFGKRAEEGRFPDIGKTDDANR